MALFVADTELLSSFRSGHPLAVQEIYKRYRQQLCFFVERVTGDTIITEDIVAEAFITSFTKKEDFADLSKLKAFLFISTGNAAKNYVKSRQRRGAIHEQLKKESSAFAGEDVEIAFLRSEAIAVIREEIEKLPEPIRKVISQSFIEGKSIDEIAENLSIAYKTVQNQKTKGVKLLRSAVLRNNLLTAQILSLALTILEPHR
jgi:RNA polymerase sigma factor (sigma-70 family)